MSEEKKTSKRKLLVRYLILAACILLIAAITVISVCAANDWFRVDVSQQIDDNKGNNDDNKDPVTPPDDNKDNEDNNKGDKPTSTDTTWVTPVATVNVITPYDFTEDITLKNCWHFHSGLDFAAEVGTPVVCCFDGTVESVVLGDELDGNKVTIKHANGVKTVYSFIDVKEGLKAGDTVKRGDKIGTVAESTGAECLLDPHIHFEVIENGEQTDPDKYLDVTIK